MEAASKIFRIGALVVLILGSINMDAQNLSNNSPIRFLALGDSYTIGESVAEVQRWPVKLAEALRAKGYNVQSPDIIAVTGWRTDQLRAAVETQVSTRNYDLVSLLIGVNNQYQGKTLTEYEKEFESLLALAIECAGNDKSGVFVLSIPDYGFTPFGKANKARISKEIDAFNEINRKISMKWGVLYIDITDISRQGLMSPALVAEDGLHPSGKMYTLWVKRILKQLGN